MVTMPPTKTMVMTGGWFLTSFYPHCLFCWGQQFETLGASGSNWHGYSLIGYSLTRYTLVSAWLGLTSLTYNRTMLSHVPWPNRGWQQRFFNQQKWAPKGVLISFAQTQMRWFVMFTHYIMDK